MWDFVSEAEAVRVVRHAPTAQAAADSLVRLASDLSMERLGCSLEVSASWQRHGSTAGLLVAGYPPLGSATAQQLGSWWLVITPIGSATARQPALLGRTF